MKHTIQNKLDSFFALYTEQKYKKGEIVIRANESPSGIFYLIEGQVKMYAISQKGEEVVLNIFKPFSFFPMSWAINGTPNSYYYEAMTPISIKRVSRQSVVEFVQRNPDIAFDLLSRVYKGVDGLLTRMTYLMSGNARSRLITEIIINAKRFGHKLSISEKDLAAQSGLTRETISREMKYLKEKNFVLLTKSALIVTNLPGLEEEVNKI